MATFSPRLETLPKPQQEIWSSLKPAISLGFVLYGGTAIALQLGHRESVDFDFFTEKELDKKAIYENMTFLHNSIVLQDEPNTLSILYKNAEQKTVKFSFFGNLSIGRFKEPLITEDDILLVASLDDLMATKLKVVMQRVEAKDYRDIAAMLKHGVSLTNGLNVANKMFEPTFSPVHCLKTLQYFEGGDLYLLTEDEKRTLQNSVNSIIKDLSITKSVVLAETLSINIDLERDEGLER